MVERQSRQVKILNFKITCRIAVPSIIVPDCAPLINQASAYDLSVQLSLYLRLDGWLDQSKKSLDSVRN